MSILSRESLKKAAYPIGIAMALFQLYYTIGYGVLEGSLLAAIFLSFALTMIFLLHPAVKPARRPRGTGLPASRRSGSRGMRHCHVSVPLLQL